MAFDIWPTLQRQPAVDDEHAWAEPHDPVALVGYGDYRCWRCEAINPTLREVLRVRPGSFDWPDGPFLC
jgi:hypothetical protein